MNITTNSPARLVPTTQKRTLTNRVAENVAAPQAQPRSEVSETPRITSWKQAIIRYRRRQAKGLEAQRTQPTLKTAETEGPAKIPSWKQAIIRYRRRQTKRLESQRAQPRLETACPEGPARIPSWKQAINRYKRRQAKLRCAGL
jgi:hypothetical protein